MTEADLAEIELLFDRSLERMIDSERFHLLMRKVVLEVCVDLEKTRRLKVPQMLVAHLAARGIYLRVNERGELVGNGKGSVDEEVRRLIGIYRKDVIRYLRTHRPQAVAPNGVKK